MGLLRTLLALSVVIGHTSAIFGVTLVNGQVAVQAFYMISGFYMTLILNEKYIGENGSFRLFITNRFLRLFPVYWVVLALYVALSLVIFIKNGGGSYGVFNIFIEQYQHLSISSIIFITFSNLFLFLQDVAWFMGLDGSTGHLFFTTNYRVSDPRVWNFMIVPQAWTIGLELTFYLIAPFVVRRNSKVILLLIVASIGLRLFLYFVADLTFDPWTYRFFPTELLFFLLGTLSYHIYKKIQHSNINSTVFNAAWGVVLAFTFCFSFLPLPFKGIIYEAIFFMALPFIFILSKNWKVDNFIGELSYPIYISHMFVLKCVLYVNINNQKWLGILVSLLTLLLSFLLNQFVAKRIEKYRQRRVIKHGARAVQLFNQGKVL